MARLLTIAYLITFTVANDISTCLRRYVNNQNTLQKLSDSQYFTTTNGDPLDCSAGMANLSTTVDLPVGSMVLNGTLPDGTTFVNATLINGTMVYDDNSFTYAYLANGTKCAVPRAKLTGMSYAFCVNFCGSAQDSFDWTYFSSNFASWLLPYLALISQLP